MPVDGPARWALTITQAVSDMVARPRASTMSERPGPEVVVMDFLPAKLAPMTMPIAPISSSACTRVPPSCGRVGARNSITSDAGVMG